MRVLGIDPGSTVTGYGIIENQRGRLVHVASGCIRTRAETPMAERLTAIHAGLAAAIEAHRPDEIAMRCLEKGFYVRYGGDTIQIAPPFIVSREQIDSLVNVLGESFNATA
jgi:crossover junction endodeoxyribonuclease RuvC